METLEDRIKRVLQDNVSVVSYVPAWPGMFAEETRHLRGCLPARLIRRIEHFGSTAPLYVDFYDPEHSADEPRYIIIGTSQQGWLLIVSYTERSGAIRLISARGLTSTEREAYEEN